MQTLASGALLQNGNYRIEQVLGQGGFGITYLAMDLNLQRKVAVKEFFPKDFCDRDETTSHVTLGTKNTSEFVSRLKSKFLKEAQNIAKLDHPNIIRIYAAFEENNTAYYVMEYIEGESLSSMVKKEGPLPENRALNYIEQVGKALEYVHARKINHLDIKPANIMVRRNDDTPILIDFGLSKQYDAEGNQTSTMPPGFSHGFAPLEQYNEGGVKDFTPQTDIYSLAATLYYILSGVVPLQATRRNDEDLTFPDLIPRRLIAPISRAMSPGRKARHSDIREFLGEIEGAEHEDDNTVIVVPKNEEFREEPIAPEIQGPVTEKPVVKSDRRIIYIIVALAVVVIIGILWFVSSSKKSNDEVDTTKAVESESVMYGIASEENKRIPFSMSLTGYVDGKYGVEMLINGYKTSEGIYPESGKYRYTKYKGAWIDLYFEVEKADDFKIYEYTNGNLTGSWDVYFDGRSDSIHGYMTNYKGVTYPVELKVVQ